MHMDYPDTADACEAVASSLRRDFPAAIFELSYHVRGQPHAQHHISHTHELAQILQRCTERFPGVRVYYTPHQAYGMVCLMECWCHHHEEPGMPKECQCDTLHNRSCIAIILHEQAGVPMLAGRHKPPGDPREHTTPPRPWRAEEAENHKH